jgi:putative ribosome biogenesis GTPase RsgA
MGNAMNYITKGIGGFYYVKTPEGIRECKARGIFRKSGIKPVAGDWVELSPDGTVIDEIRPRKNVFVRPPIANLDVLFIVASTVQPVPSTLVLDQLAAAAIYKDVQPILVVTKADLGAADTLVQAYKTSGIPLVQLNYETGEGLDEIKAQIIRAGFTMQEVVDRLAEEYDWSDSVSNLSAKLQRESIRYKEVVELADVLDCDIVWMKRGQRR